MKDSLPIAVALLLLAATFFMPSVPLRRATYDHLVVFDISQSMNVEDYELNGWPASRLAYARESVRRALSDLPCGSRVGWGAFAEYRTILLLSPIEVCSNYSDLLASLDRIDGRMRWGNASEIGKGVYWALRAAKGAGAPNVLFLTDGHEAPPLQSGGVALFDDLKRGEIHGWLIGVGGYTPRPIPKFDAEGRRVGYWHAYEVVQVRSDDPARETVSSHEHLSELREPRLRELARDVDFKYMRLGEPGSIRQAMLDPGLADHKAVSTDVYWLPASFALILLCMRFRPESLPRRRRR